MVKKLDKLHPEIIGNPDGIVHYSKAEKMAFEAIVLDRAKKRTPKERQRNEFMGIYAEVISYVDNPIKENSNMDIGCFIKKLLAIYNLPQKKLADYLGLNKSNFSALMNGNRKINFDLALKLAHIFGIKADLWLMVQNKNELWKLEKANKKEYEKYSLKGLIAT